MKSNNQVSVIKIEQRVKPFINKVEALKIKDEASMEEATELLSQANSLLKSIKEEHEAQAEPFKTPLKEIDQAYAPTEKTLKSLIDLIRQSMSTYQTQVTNTLKSKEQSIVDRIGDGKGKLKFETAVTKIEELEKPATKLKTDSWSLSFREKLVLKVIDPSLIPLAYLIPDENKILSALKAGQEVPGCVIEIIQVPINRTK